MSWQIIKAVHESRIEPRLRFLAATLAFHAHDDGTTIHPGISLLTQALGVSESGVREGLQALVNSQVLVRDGYHRHTRQFRFDLERLASYRPAAVSRAAWRATLKPNRATLRHGVGLDDDQPYAMAKGSESITLRHGVANPTPRRSEPYAMAATTLRHGVAHIERQERQERQEQTGADAPARSDEKPEEQTEERLGTEGESPANTRGGNFPPPSVNGRIPFKVYAALASQAVANSLADDKSDDLGNIAEHFKRLCAQQGKPYSATLVQRAVDAAWAAREKERRQFIDNLRQHAGAKAMR